MQLCDIEQNEPARLKAVRDLEILDTAPEPEFDELVQIAAAICGAPISVVSLIDEERQWFKASFGLEIKETPREVAFCNHTIRQRDILLVEDATRDPRFASNPMVTGDAGVRFYAGVPVDSPDGQPVGTLCVIDHTPRTLSHEQRSALRVLAAQVNARLELRLQRRELEKALAEAEATRARLAASEHLFQKFMDNGPFLSYIKDTDGRMLYYNQLMARQFDVSRTFLLNKTDAELWPTELANKYRRNDLEVLESGELRVREEQTRNPDGSVSSWRSYKFPYTDMEGRQLLGGVSVDVTEELRRGAELRRYQAELESANQRLTELASVDALTGLANRRIFDERLKISFRQARKSGSPLCLLLIDVDNFKQHNDQHGHQHGDEVLRRLGELLQSQLRAGDLPARYGGEEFTVLLPDTGLQDALALAGRLLREIRAADWPTSPVTVSAGISSLGPATSDTQRLLTLADDALYAAKRAGKDRVVSYQQVYEEALAAASNKISEE